MAGKKDSDKSPSNHRKTVRTSKGKALNIKNYGQTLVRDHSEIESVLQRARFEEIEFTQALEHQAVILEEEDCIIATQAVNELPLCFLQKTYCSKTEKVEKNLLYKFGKGTSTRKVL